MTDGPPNIPGVSCPRVCSLYVGCENVSVAAAVFVAETFGKSLTWPNLALASNLFISCNVAILTHLWF